MDLACETPDQRRGMALAQGTISIASRPYSRAKALDRLFAKVEFDPNSGCWLWWGSTVRKGYGSISLTNRYVQTHRLSYALHRGSPGKNWVLHRCDTSACCNPDHLFLGDAKANNQDRSSKGRSSGGRLGGCRKLSDDQVREILTYRDAGTLTPKEIGAIYGVRGDHVSAIWRGKKRRMT